MLDEHELVESLDGVFDRGERADRVLQLLFRGVLLLWLYLNAFAGYR